MRNKLLLILSIAFFAFISNAQNPIPNGNFENWLTTPDLEPQYYITSNQQSLGKGLPYSVVQDTNAFSNNYSIVLTTEASATDTVTAFVANGDPGNPVGQGIPYAETPFSIRGYYKSAIQPGDTGLVIAVFKNSGNIIGMYVFKLYGTHSNYTLFDFPLVPALPMAPDSFIFAATPSNALTGSFPGIPGSMLQLDSISFTGVASQPAMFNGDFENWTNNPVISLPNWSVNNKGNMQGTDFFTGSYCLELHTELNQSGNVRVGTATTGISVPSGTIGGYPFSNQVDTAVFHYKYFRSDAADSASITLMFKTGGVFTSNITLLLDSSSSYKYVEFPFNLATAPDTLIVYLSSSKNSNPPSSYSGAVFKIDDLYMKSQVAPVADFGLPASVCANQVFALSDSSTGGASAWAWSLPGASPLDTSNVQNPALSYDSAGTYTITLVASNAAGQSAPVSKTITVLPQPTVSLIFSPNDSVCRGTLVMLSGSGNAVSYSWSNAVTDGVAFADTVTNKYFVTGTDGNGCTNMDSILVVVHSLPNVGINASAAAVCEGDSVTLSGTGADSYSWTGGITDGVAFAPAPISDYTVTGTDTNGCSNTAIINITINTPPSVGYTIVTGFDTICQGDSVMLSGTGALTYSWSNGITNNTLFSPVSDSTYYVTGTDGNGCTNMDSVLVVVHSLPNVGINASAAAVCEGDSVTLSGTGANSYSWAGGITDGLAFAPSSISDYTVTGTDVNGCSDTAIISITINTPPSVGYTIVTGFDTICQGDSVMLSGTGALTYSWSNGITNNTLFSPVSDSTYYVTGTDGNGCANTDSVTIVVSVCTGIKSVEEVNRLSIFPNPVNTNAIIQFNTTQQQSRLILFDAAGRQVKGFTVGQGVNTFYFDRENLNSGIYFFSLFSGKNSIAKGKIIIE